MGESRRNFIRQTSCGVLSATALLAGIKRFGLFDVMAQTSQDYKALVCIFLFGGNDANNTVIPIDEYAQYSAVRDTPTNINIPQASLLPITPSGITGGDTRRYGMHPNLTPLHELWTQQKLAILCNAGTLVRPLTRTEYQTMPSLRPSQLFSHSDQTTQWQTSISQGQSPTGWGGRTADYARTILGTPTFPMVASVSGAQIFARGQSTSPVILAPHPTPLNQALQLQGFTTSAPDMARLEAMQQLWTIDTEQTLVSRASAVSQQAYEISRLLGTNPTFAGFPNTGLGNQLYQVAKVISLRNQLTPGSVGRQIFFCSLGGFDTHSNQLASHVNLFTQLSQAMRAFYDWSVLQGVASNVTTFTLSDFGRTFHPSTGAGSDHGWGTHQFIMGGAVRGGDFYGTPGPSGGVFPALVRNGPNDADQGTGARGRWIPTTSVDQYAATLAKWYGVPDPSIPTIFPNIGQFGSRNLQFMI